MRRFTIAGPGSAQTLSLKFSAGTSAGSKTTQSVAGRTPPPRLADIERRHVGAIAKEIARKNAEKIGKAVEKVKSKTARKSSLYERFYKDAIKTISRMYPDLWKCYRSGYLCALPSHLAPVKDYEVKAIEDRYRRVHELAREIAGYAGVFRAAGVSDEENPAIVAASILRAGADAAATVLRADPRRLLEVLYQAARFGQAAKKLVAKAAEQDKRWSRKYCDKIPGCITASSPRKTEDGCVKKYIRGFGTYYTPMAGSPMALGRPGTFLGAMVGTARTECP